MNQTAIFWPMIVHALLVYCLYALISKRRIAAISAGHAKASQFRENTVEPEESLFVRNNLANQFELPTLFYPLCIALFVTGGATFFAVILAWLFVATRAVHSWVHITTNRIRHRRPLFIAGFAVLAVMWAYFALHLAGLT